MRRRAVYLVGGLAIALVWAVAVAAMVWGRSRGVTAETVIEDLGDHPLDQSMPPDARAEALDGLAYRLNRLPFEERREVRMSRALEACFRAMTDRERSALLNRTPA